MKGKFDAYVFDPKSSKLISRPVYYSRLYGISDSIKLCMNGPLFTGDQTRKPISAEINLISIQNFL